MKSIRASETVWLGVNGLMSLVFLWLSSRQWIEPELRSVPGASGGAPVVFTMLVVWLLAPLLIVNLIWLGVAISRARRNGGGQAGPTWLFGLIAIAWIGLVLFSASRV